MHENIGALIFNRGGVPEEGDINLINEDFTNLQSQSINDELTQKDFEDAQILWNYMKLGHKVNDKSDLIIVFGNYDVRTAEHACQLWLEGKADSIMFSGKNGNLTEGIWEMTEAETFCEIAVSMGIPRSAIILETDSSSIYENIIASWNTLVRLERIPRSVILVHKPFMERRIYASFMKLWPGIVHNVTHDVVMTSPDITFADYPNEYVGSAGIIAGLLVGSIQRIMTYPKAHLMTKQKVPTKVKEACKALVSTGRYHDFLVAKKEMKAITSYNKNQVQKYQPPNLYKYLQKLKGV